MKLLRFAAARYEVLMVYGENDRPMVLEFLAAIDQSLANKMIRLLEHHVAILGPPRNKEKYRHLRDGIWEFKAGQRVGPKLRVLCFGDGDQFICTHGFLKDQQKTPKREIDRAIAIRDDYSDAKQDEQIEIVDLGVDR